MIRLDDIKELLEAVEADISDFHETIREATIVNPEDSDTILSRRKIKRVFEDIRSILDYSAMDISEKISRGNSKYIYFPYGKNKGDFYSRVVSYFGKQLQITHNDIYLLLESMQDFTSSKKWLSAVCEFTNYIKHDALGKPQNEVQASGFILNGAIKSENSTIIFEQGARFFDPLTGQYTHLGRQKGTPIEIRPDMTLSQLERQLDESVKIEIIEGKARPYISVNNLQYDLLDLLDTALVEVKEYIDKLYSFIK